MVAGLIEESYFSNCQIDQVSDDELSALEDENPAALLMYFEIFPESAYVVKKEVLRNLIGYDNKRHVLLSLLAHQISQETFEALAAKWEIECKLQKEELHYLLNAPYAWFLRLTKKEWMSGIDDDEVIYDGDTKVTLKDCRCWDLMAAISWGNDAFPNTIFNGDAKEIHEHVEALHDSEDATQFCESFIPLSVLLSLDAKSELLITELPIFNETEIKKHYIEFAKESSDVVSDFRLNNFGYVSPKDKYKQQVIKFLRGDIKKLSHIESRVIKDEFRNILINYSLAGKALEQLLTLASEEIYQLLNELACGECRSLFIRIKKELYRCSNDSRGCLKEAWIDILAEGKYKEVREMISLLTVFFGVYSMLWITSELLMFLIIIPICSGLTELMITQGLSKEHSTGFNSEAILGAEEIKGSLAIQLPKDSANIDRESLVTSGQ